VVLPPAQFGVVNVNAADPNAPTDTPKYGARTTPLTPPATAPKTDDVTEIFPDPGCKSKNGFPADKPMFPTASDTFPDRFVIRNVPPNDRVDA
jgi:hypothetical protein